ncbi:MAG: hypothetical protein ACK4M4_00905 [Flavobacterium sp.]
MEVQINYVAGVYEVKGLLNSQNCVHLENHLLELLTRNTGLVLSLEKVIEMDCYAAKGVLAIYEQAILNDKSLYIIGYKNKSVLNQFSLLQKNEVLL